MDLFYKKICLVEKGHSFNFLWLYDWAQIEGCGSIGKTGEIKGICFFAKDSVL